MKDKKTDIQHEDTSQETQSSPHEVRTEARRRLIKAGLMSVPVIMTVHSRPLFAQTNGSVGALAYGGYEGTTQSDTVFQDQNQTPTTTVAPGYTDPYGDNPGSSGAVDSGDSTFRRSRDPRSRY